MLLHRARLLVISSSTTLARTVFSMASPTPVSLSASPAAGQLVEHDGKAYTTVREGLAYILTPPNAQTSVDPKASNTKQVSQNVFYNPIQQFNRDLSVLAIQAFGEHSCARKRRKHEHDSSKNAVRKDRKRKRRVVQDGEEGNEEEDDKDAGGVKLRRVQGSDSAVAEGLVRQQAAEEAPEIEEGRERSLSQDQGVQHSNVNQKEATSEGPVPPTVEGTVDDQADTGSVPSQSNGKSWAPQFRILDALSATGLRALRYAQEIPFATDITANDMDRKAVDSIRLNVQHNKLSTKITPTTGNAMAHMYSVAFPPGDSHGPSHVSSKYDVIDLDPYGTAAPFIDSALQALNDDGMLCVTCTDAGVWASCGYSEKTFSLYGGIPVKGSHSHEAGLRIILHSIAAAAAKYGLSIEPLLSLSIDFYARMFIRVRKSPADVKFLAGKTMIVYSCDSGCGAWTTQMFGRNVRHTGNKTNNIFYKHTIGQAPTVDRVCGHCGSKTHVAGPMWAGPLHNAAFVANVLSDARKADAEIYQTKPRIEGMLVTALEEVSVIDNPINVWNTDSDTIPQTPPEVVDLHPFFFIPSTLARVIHCIAPGEAPIKGALRHAGYRVTRSHCKPGSIKTDAPWSVIWEIMREWVRQKAPIKEGALKKTSPGYRIMQAARPAEEAENTSPMAATGSTTGAEAIDGMNAPITTEVQIQSDSIPSPKRSTPEPARIKVVFDEALGRDQPSKSKLVRYQQNPRENWGPMTKAKGSA